MSIKLQNILLKMANDVLDLGKSGKTLGEPIDDAEQAILDLLDKELDRLEGVTVKSSIFQPLYANLDREAAIDDCRKLLSAALADVRKVIKED